MYDFKVRFDEFVLKVFSAAYAALGQLFRAGAKNSRYF